MPKQSSVDSAVDFISNVMLETAENAGMTLKTGFIPKGAIPHRSARANSGSCKRNIHPK